MRKPPLRSIGKGFPGVSVEDGAIVINRLNRRPNANPSPAVHHRRGDKAAETITAKTSTKPKAQALDATAKTNPDASRKQPKGRDKAQKSVGSRKYTASNANGDCSADWPCAKLGCPNCRGRAHSAMVDSALNLFDLTQPIIFLTIIPVDGYLPLDGLADFDLVAFRKRHHQKVRRCLPPGVLAVGAVDISLEVIENVESHWQAHIHLLIQGLDLTSKRIGLIRAAYPSDEGLRVKRPVACKWVTKGTERTTLGYALKRDFERRSCYLAIPAQGSDRNPYWTSDSQGLKPDSSKMLDAALMSHTVGDLLLLFGVRRNRSSDPMHFSFTKFGKEG